MTLTMPHGATERARDLHQRAIILLAHDHKVTLDDFRADHRGGVTAKVVQAVVDARVFESRPVYEGSLYSFDGFLRDAMTAYDWLLSTVEANPSELLVVRTAEDIRTAKETGKLGLILGSEGAKHLEGSAAVLRNLFRLGVRQVQLHWAIRNQLGTAQSDLDEPGLTDFGRQVISEMNRLGMLIDVSHSSPASIEDALATTTKPVINSHTGARDLNPVSGQLLWDDEIKALADNGGVACIHFNTSVLIGRQTTRLSTVEDVLSHIEHVVEVGGIECVGLGPDFIPGGKPGERIRFNQRIPPEFWRWTAELDSSQLLPNLTIALVERGYSDSDILKILGGNLMRVLSEVLPSLRN
jgi:membrane dipeptidase